MCLNPRDVNYVINKEGKKVLMWHRDFIESAPYVTIPCGKCIECQTSYSNAWVLRCQAELKEHKQSCFLTLTYADNPVILVKKDFQDFMKRLREHLQRKFSVYIRFFGCGEYGSKKGRPHFHVLIFGWCPDDLRFMYTDKSGVRIYTSSFLESVWKHGFCSVGVDMEERAIRYLCKYMQKQNYPTDTTTGEIVKPFLLMSRRPGIGANLALSSECDFTTDKVYFAGKTLPIPRYYLARLEREGFDLSPLKRKRERFQKLVCQRSLSELQAKRDFYVKKFGYAY